jgi:hypothetical protein
MATREDRDHCRGESAAPAGSGNGLVAGDSLAERRVYFDFQDLKRHAVKAGREKIATKVDGGKRVRRWNEEGLMDGADWQGFIAFPCMSGQGSCRPKRTAGLVRLTLSFQA